MTLAEVLPATRLLSATEKLKLVRILVEDLDTSEAVSPLKPSADQQEEANQQLLRFAGAISLGYATGIENESIDTDLAKAYANEF
jgi:hypothetical protein